MLFTAVDAIVHKGDVAVISGNPGTARTALMLALSGRFTLTAGTLHTADGAAFGAAALRRRIAVAQALPVIRTESSLRVSEAIAECRIIGGRKNVTAQAVWHALTAMGSEMPPPNVLVQDMGTVEQILFGLALAYTQNADGICFDDVDGSLPLPDREFVRAAVRDLASLGPALIVTSCDPGWGTVDIPLLPAQSPVSRAQAAQPVQDSAEHVCGHSPDQDAKHDVPDEPQEAAGEEA